jgi:hypothetical protein
MNLLKVARVDVDDSEYINPAKIIKIRSTEAGGAMIVLDDGQYTETTDDKDAVAMALRNL